MNLHEIRSPNVAGARFGQHYETADGATVIPVSHPVGIFVVEDGRSTWVPATDATRVALAGILVGLVATTLAGVAMLRRPPWPDLHGDVTRR